MSYQIALDCEPGTPRPDCHLPNVLVGTDLTMEDFEIISKFFGEWIFKLKDDQKGELYVKNKAVIGERIKKLYDDGSIRYGAW
jgi:hypothetical protein